MNDLLHVVHLVVAGSIGGAERLLVDLATRPEESGAKHTVALISHDETLPGFFDEAALVVRYGGCIPHNPVNYLRTTFGPRSLDWLDGVLVEEKPDVLHLHTFGSHLLGVQAGQRAGIPTLRTEHHIYHYDYPSMSPFTRWAARRTTRFAAVSDYVRREVASRAPYTAEKMETIRNGIDVSRFRYVPMDPAARGGEPVVFAVVCRLDRWKGVDLAIEGLAAVPNAILRVAGTGPDLPRLQAAADRAGVADRVEFLGYLTDVRPVIEEADVAVSGADREPLGLSVLEALAVGRPMIAFVGGGIPEVVQHGSTGWLVHERTGTAYGEAMRAAAGNRETLAAMGEAGRRFVERECTIESMCNSYADVYRETIDAYS